MKSFMVSVPLLLLGFVANSQADTKDQFVAQVNGRISVSSEGAVAGVILNNVTSAELRAFLEKQIKAWEFHPMLVNGSPVQADAGFHFRLLASFSGDGKLRQIAFQDVIVEPTQLELEAAKGVRDSTRRVAPQYPYVPLKEGVEAELQVAAKILPNGTVSEAAVSELAILGARKDISASMLAKAQNDFSKSAASAIKQWRFSPEMLAKYDCVDGCVSNIAVTFELSGAPWKSYRAMPVPGIPWLIAEHLKDVESTKSRLVRFKQQPSEQQIDIGS